MTRVLLTSVCRPMGPDHGDAPSVGYELLHGQVTRAQGMFSPRSLHHQFALDYIAENLEASCVVLQYPSRRELIRELRKGYDYVAVSFLMAVFHRMRDAVALIRAHAPEAKIILGGYGTVLSDEVLAPYSDHICREEGVGFLRRLLGEPELPMPYRHPVVVSQLKVFGTKVSRTGLIFGGLGCPNGCDFCCTSHFFQRRHIKLLPTGADLYRVVRQYLDIDPDMSLLVIDEDFLLNKRRAMEFRDCVLRGGKPLAIFVFASIRALSQYTVEEIVEMGIDGLWIGYEGTRSGYPKQEGRPPEELFTELREHGISVLASMIVGLPYQDEAIVEEELAGLLRLQPDLCQFLIYGPPPGTPFFERVQREGLLREEYAADPERFYRVADGFRSLVKHPSLEAEQIEALQQHCFRADFERLGPSIYRSLETWLKGWRTLRRSERPALRRKAERFARELRRTYPVFLAGRLFGPNAAVRRKIGALQREIHGHFGRPTLGERAQALVAVGAALWTAFTLKFKLFQHPRLVRNTYRMPLEAPRAARAWRRLVQLEPVLSLERLSGGTLRLRLNGALEPEDAAALSLRLRAAMKRTRERLLLDLEHLTKIEEGAARQLAEALRDYRQRIQVLVPAALGHPGVAAALAVFTLYRGPVSGV